MAPLTERLIRFDEVAELAGFLPGADGRLNLPATQDTLDRLARATDRLLGAWSPGDARYTVVLTGAGPVWGYLAIAHICHGRAVALRYQAPNADLKIYGHGA